MKEKTEGNDMNTSLLKKIERKSSIDDEPRTLTFDQLRYAREAALYVLSTKTIEEAIEIFTEGLQPVLSTRDNMDLELTIKDNMDLDDDAEMLDCVEMEHIDLPFPGGEGISSPF